MPCSRSKRAQAEGGELLLVIPGTAVLRITAPADSTEKRIVEPGH
jgi:hypothetical protein